MQAAFLAKRAVHTTCRRLSTAQHPLVTQLLRNAELTLADAKNELRWLRDAAGSHENMDNALENMVKRRAGGEPLQYILGSTDFGPLELLARPPVLIARPETAFVVEDLAQRLLAGPVSKRPLRILDLCTGSGCIPLLLSRLLGESLATVYAVDISDHAVALAWDNAALHSDSRVQVIKADILAPDFLNVLSNATSNEPIDIITANPPYVTATEWESLPHSVKNYEDRQALVGGPVDGVGDGVAFYAHITRLASSILRPDADLASIPRLAVEIGAEQATSVSGLIPGRTEVIQDQYGRDRMVLGWV